MRYLLVLILVLLVMLVLPVTAQDTEGREIQGLELLEDYPAVQFWFKAYARHYPDTLHEKCTEYITGPDARQYQTAKSLLITFHGIEGIKADFEYYPSVRPNLTFTIESVIAEDNSVAVRYTAHYTGRVRPDEKTYPAMAMFHLEADRLHEIWHYFNWCDMGFFEC